MAFADLTYYKNDYLGNKISDNEFPRLAERGAEYITALTFQRVTNATFPNLTNYQDQIKKANCAIAEIIKDLEQSHNKSSESTGNWSITYDISKDEKRNIYKVLAMFLQGTGLLYAGVDCYVESNYNTI